jgi:hypothetical protein
MEDYVAYHNSDCMGRLRDSDSGLSVLTNKSGLDVKGSRVWLIVGEGKPRRYYLSLWFIANAVGPDHDHGFSAKISGVEGQRFSRKAWLPLNDEPWFPAFLKSQSNFRFGLNLIKDADVARELWRLAEEARSGA